MRMKEAKKILYVAQEMVPYLPESKMAKICRELPPRTQEDGREMRAFMPRYGCINERRNQLHEVIRLSGMNLIIDDTDHPLIIKVASLSAAHIQVYFIDNEDYFQRKQLYRDLEGVEFADNNERVIFFSRGVIETVRKLRWEPSVVAVNGWLGALIPIYVKKVFNDDPQFKSSKVVTVVYEDDFKTPFPATFKENLKLDGIEDKDLTVLDKEVTYVDLMKLAFQYSDGVVFTSKNVDAELLKEVERLKLPNVTIDKEEDYTQDYLEFFDRIAE